MILFIANTNKRLKLKFIFIKLSLINLANYIFLLLLLF